MTEQSPSSNAWIQNLVSITAILAALSTILGVTLVDLSLKTNLILGQILLISILIYVQIAKKKVVGNLHSFRFPESIRKWTFGGLIGVAVLFILTVLFLETDTSKPPDSNDPVQSDSECFNQDQIIYIAKSELLDINKEYVSDNLYFSNKLRVKLEDNVSSEFSVKGLSVEYDYRNRDSVEELFENDSCKHRGMFVNSNYFPKKKICDVYIDFVRLKLPNPHLIENKRIIIDTPPNIQFEINSDASLISDIIIAVLYLYENKPKKSIKQFNRFEVELNLEKQKKLKAFVKLSKGNAYLMIGDKYKAIEAFSQVKSLGYFPDIIASYEMFLVIPDQAENTEVKDDKTGVEDKKTDNQEIAYEGEVVDKSGTIYPYKTMKDGKKWIAKNLNIEINSSWCYDDAPKNCEKYGRLYNWEAAKKACAQLGDGWHLPTDEEWTKMVDYYGGTKYGKAKDKGKAVYQELAEKGLSGFNALLGGHRSIDGSFLYLGTYGYYWSATGLDRGYGRGYAYNYVFFGDDERLYRFNYAQDLGLSVRCLQN